MSYRPDSQSLEKPGVKIMEGIEEFDSAVLERIRSGEWSDSHLTELRTAMLELNRVKYSLAHLVTTTW